MNAPSNAMPEPFDTKKVFSATMPAIRPLYWSVRRELWQYRSIYLVPLAVSAVMLFGFLIGTIGRALSTPDLALRRQILEEPYIFATAVVMATMFIVSVYYCGHVPRRASRSQHSFLEVAACLGSHYGAGKGEHSICTPAGNRHCDHLCDKLDHAAAEQRGHAGQRLERRANVAAVVH